MTVIFYFQFQDGTVNSYEIKNPSEAAMQNYIRMNTDHFEVMLLNMGYRVPPNSGQDDNEDRQESLYSQPLNCRPS